MGEVKFNVTEHIGTLKPGDHPVELNLVGWGNMRPIYDLRRWKLKDGTRVPLKGLTLDMDGLRALRDILNGMELGEDE